MYDSLIHQSITKFCAKSFETNFRLCCNYDMYKSPFYNSSITQKSLHISSSFGFFLPRSGNNLSAGLVNLETSIATEKGEKEEEKTIVAVVLANALVIRYD